MTTDMNSMVRAARSLILGVGLGLSTLALACSDDGVADTGETGGACEPGEVIDCACPDGSTSTQACNAEGTGYEECGCGETSGNTGDGDPGDGDPGDGDPGDGDPGDGDPGDGDPGDGDGDPGDGDPGDGDGDPGEDPVPSIFHPGDQEMRQVNVPIPFIGEATDAEDGMLTGMSIVWTSDLEGQIGTGTSFDAPLTMVGIHTITMTATDSDNQQGTDSIQLIMQ